MPEQLLYFRSLIDVANKDIPLMVVSVLFPMFDRKQIAEVYKLSKEDRKKLLTYLETSDDLFTANLESVVQKLANERANLMARSNRKPVRRAKPQKERDIQQRLGLMLMIERKKAGLTQRQCAVKLKIAEAAWGNGENGRNVSVARLLEMIGIVNPAALPEAVKLAKEE